MSNTPKILAFAGSTRSDSYNKKLVKQAMLGAEATGAQATFVDLRDFPMPLYDGDLEEQEGLSPAVLEFKALLMAHQGLLIASPEYNSALSGVLKNTIDWASRPQGEEAPLVCFKGKVCSLMSASPGALGGLRGLATVRSILGNIGVIVLPDQVAVSQAYDAFDPGGKLVNAHHQQAIEALGANVAHMLIRLGR